ncbi:M36 family metallopeptidase [Streptomyces sp. NPDC060048]|uniref:M36 family metallopeptidase n=1 Tax=unclassified Streptomyces TaxID=2593676 RepID=UPI003681BF30
MSETTPEANDHGPAPVQMSPGQAAKLGLTPTPEGTTPTAPTPIPADQVKPEDIGRLAIEYRDGQPVIVVSGGKYVPAGLRVVHATTEGRAASIDVNTNAATVNAFYVVNAIHDIGYLYGFTESASNFDNSDFGAN